MYILRTSTLFLKTTSLHRFDECIRNTLQAIFNVMVDDPRWELMTLPCLVLLIILSNLLLCCGDIKPNPRPIVQFNDISEKLNSYGNKIKSTLKLQEFKQKRSNLQKLVNTCGLNTIYGVSGTWFNDSKEKNLRTLYSDHFDVIDQQSQAKKIIKGGGVMLLIPKTLHPTLRRDLNLFHQKYDSIWVDFKISKNKTERSTFLNISYTPSKSNKIEFVDNFALSVDFAQTYNSNIVLLGDYNLNYSNTQAKQSLDTILTPYNLEVVNKTTPTHSKTLIDYFNTDLNSPN